MNVHRLGAIDIGSNGIRLLISNVIEEQGKAPVFTKYSLVRVPIRLGMDVFKNGFISKENADLLAKTMSAYRLLLEVYDVKKYRACATAAMREAANGKEVLDYICKKSNINLEIISGLEEAKMVSNTTLFSFMEKEKNYIYIDVGGGSTEFTIFTNGKNILSKSFHVGTIRLLQNQVSDSVWKELEDWIVSNTENFPEIQAIGSGGNINSVSKNSKIDKKNGTATLSFLKEYLRDLEKYSYEERIKILKLNPDRADVINHAIRIYVQAMEWAGAKMIYIPKVGLTDGIIRELYYGK